ncbi:MAG: GGDEF domain-containing protein [Dongiaceae bacterium]
MTYRTQPRKNLSDELGKVLPFDLWHSRKQLEQLAKQDANGENSLWRAALWMLSEAQAQIAGQKKRIKELEELAMTDAATGLLNRRGFEFYIGKIMRRLQRHSSRKIDRRQSHGVVMMVDLDGFKQINDRYGHAAGDMMLLQLSKTLSENVRDSDLVARLGGDEFAVVLTDTNIERATERAQKLGKVINRSSILWQGADIPLSASIGLTSIEAEMDLSTLLTRADAAMYARKEQRRLH